jgi:RNA recognition motif-containing protein
MKLYVGNLSFDITERRELFEPFGTVSEVKLIMDRETGQSRGFGFVTMGNVSEGNAAIKGLHGRIRAAANSRLMRLAQKLLDRVANSLLHHLAPCVRTAIEATGPPAEVHGRDK